MKKYFIADTEEEISLGDVVQVGLENKSKYGTHRFESEVKVTEKEIPFLLDFGVIEEREVEDEDEDSEEEMVDFDKGEDPCPYGYGQLLDATIEDQERLEGRVESLEQEIRQLKGMHKDYVALTHKMLDTFKEFVLSLPDKESKNAQPKKK